MCKVYVITSGKGGVGKTTISANLAYALAEIRMDKKILIIDMDIGLRNLDIVMGLENKIVFNILDVLRNRCNISQAIIRSGRYNNLSLLPASQTGNAGSVSSEELYRLLEVLRDNYDYILIDCPAGCENGFMNSVKYADEAISVVLPDVSSVRDADKIINLLGQYGIPCNRLVVNRYNRRYERFGYTLNKNDISDILGIECVYTIPDDMNIIRANNFSRKAYGRKTQNAYITLAKDLA